MLDKKRDTRYDFLRVIAMGAVILIHSIDSVSLESTFRNRIFYEVIATFVLICNPIFFMMSGHFNLHFKGKNKSDYKKFYAKKLVTIVLPLVCYQIIFFFGNLVSSNKIGKISLLQLLKQLTSSILQDYSSIYFWFMYVLLAFLIAAPFLSKMLDNLTADGKLYFTSVLIVFQIVTWILKLFGINFGVSAYPFSGWLIYFLLGRLLETKKINFKWMVFLTIIIVPVVNVLLVVNSPNVNTLGLHDLSPLYILFSVAIYLFLLNSQSVIRISKSRYAYWLSYYSFEIYLVHGTVMLFLTNRIKTGSGLINIIVTFIAVYFISLVVVILLDKVFLKPTKEYLLSKLQ